MAITNNANGSKTPGRPANATAPPSLLGSVDDSAGGEEEEEGFSLGTSEPDGPAVVEVVVAEADGSIVEDDGLPDEEATAVVDDPPPPTTELYSSLHTATVWSGQQGS